MKKLLLALALLAAPAGVRAAEAPPPPPAPLVLCRIEGVSPVAVCYDADGKRLLIA